VLVAKPPEERLKHQYDMSYEEEEDDPNKLWCICRRPYTEDTFMIACDTCNEWYHGDCVGINEDAADDLDVFECALCAGDEALWTQQVHRVQQKLKQEQRRKEQQRGLRGKASLQRLKRVRRDDDDYSSDSEEEDVPLPRDRSHIVRKPAPSPSSASASGSAARPALPSRLSMAQAALSTARPVSRRPVSSFPSSSVSSSSASSASSRLARQQAQLNMQFNELRKRQLEVQQRNKARMQRQPAQYWTSIRDKIVESLTTVLAKEHAQEVEQELFTLIGDGGRDYKIRFRDLIMNLRDPNNPTLLQRVKARDITPHALVRMSVDQLASKELHKQRQQAHQEFLKNKIRPVEKHVLPEELNTLLTADTAAPTLVSDALRLGDEEDDSTTVIRLASEKDKEQEVGRTKASAAAQRSLDDILGGLKHGSKPSSSSSSSSSPTIPSLADYDFDVDMTSSSSSSTTLTEEERLQQQHDDKEREERDKARQEAMNQERERLARIAAQEDQEREREIETFKKRQRDREERERKEREEEEERERQQEQEEARRRKEAKDKRKGKKDKDRNHKDKERERERAKFASPSSPSPSHAASSSPYDSPSPASASSSSASSSLPSAPSPKLGEVVWCGSLKKTASRAFAVAAVQIGGPPVSCLPFLPLSLQAAGKLKLEKIEDFLTKICKTSRRKVLMLSLEPLDLFEEYKDFNRSFQESGRAAVFDLQNESGCLIYVMATNHDLGSPAPSLAEDAEGPLADRLLQSLLKCSKPPSKLWALCFLTQEAFQTAVHSPPPTIPPHLAPNLHLTSAASAAKSSPASYAQPLAPFVPGGGSADTPFAAPATPFYPSSAPPPAPAPFIPPPAPFIPPAAVATTAATAAPSISVPLPAFIPPPSSAPVPAPPATTPALPMDPRRRAQLQQQQQQLQPDTTEVQATSTPTATPAALPMDPRRARALAQAQAAVSVPAPTATEPGLAADASVSGSMNVDGVDTAPSTAISTPDATNINPSPTSVPAPDSGDSSSSTETNTNASAQTLLPSLDAASVADTLSYLQSLFAKNLAPPQ